MEQVSKVYNSTKLHRELEAAGLAVEGVTSEGRIDWKGNPGKAEMDQAAALLADHQAEDVSEKRRQAYQEKGLSAEALIMALWEKVIEGDSTAADALQAIREQVKQEIT